MANSIFPSPSLVLLYSLTVYPSILRVLAGRNPTSSHLSASIRVVSTVHSSLTTLLALKILYPLTELKPVPASLGPQSSTTHPLIAPRNNAANALTALETGYLLSSIPSLLAEARAHGRKPSKLMLAHHAGIGTALAVLQTYIWRGKEKGIYIIVMMLLMNASTPFLNLRWLFNRKFIYGWPAQFVNCTFLMTFLCGRVLLLPAVIRYYGYLKGLEIRDTWNQELRWQCKLGTAAIWLANTVWFFAACHKIGREDILEEWFRANIITKDEYKTAFVALER